MTEQAFESSSLLLEMPGSAAMLPLNWYFHGRRL